MPLGSSVECSFLNHSQGDIPLDLSWPCLAIYSAPRLKPKLASLYFRSHSEGSRRVTMVVRDNYYVLVCRLRLLTCLVASYIFDHPLLPPSLPPYRRRHDKKKTHCGRAERSCQENRNLHRPHTLLQVRPPLARATSTGAVQIDTRIRQN